MPSLRLLISVAVVTAAGAFAPVGNNHPKPAVSTRGGREHIGSRTVFRSAEKPWWKVWGDKDGGGEGDITSSPAFLEKKLGVLQKELEQQEEKLAENEAIAAAELEEWGPQISQLQSEFKFLQARTFNESKEADTMARASVVKEILPVVDNFDRAKASLKAETDAEQAILDLYEGIFADINSVLESFDMQVIPSVGAEFDYNLHEAIQQMPSDEYDADIVCQEFQKGYTIGGKLVRPAIVAVSIGM